MPRVKQKLKKRGKTHVKHALRIRKIKNKFKAKRRKMLTGRAKKKGGRAKRKAR